MHMYVFTALLTLFARLWKQLQWTLEAMNICQPIRKKAPNRAKCKVDN